MNEKQKIVVIGCGPKALAIYAKAKVLKTLGHKVPEVIVIEKSEIGAHWSGKNGYTDGKSTLAISPLKDIGYPYESIFGKEVDLLMEQYSFTSYLKNQKKFTAWVDGGSLPITHNDMSRYLKWVSTQLKLEPTVGEVIKLIPKGKRWKVVYINKNIDKKLICDVVVITGPGDVLGNVITPKTSNIYNAKNFWQKLTQFNNLNNEKIALIGSGTSGGTIFERLMPILDNKSHVDWYTRRGMYTRSENFSNNQIYSHANRWNEIPEKFRDEFIRRTDHGAIDIAIHSVMARFHENFSFVFGVPESIKISKNKKLVVQCANNKSNKVYNKVIIATGFDNLNFLSLLPKDFKKEGNLNCPELEIAKRLELNLSVSELTPKLHLPMLAWHNYGIGISDLSCLSTLSDRILQTYIN